MVPFAAYLGQRLGKRLAPGRIVALGAAAIGAGAS